MFAVRWRKEGCGVSDWQVGDLAVYVDDGPARLPLRSEGLALIRALKLGSTYHVREVRMNKKNTALCLKFEGFDYRVGTGQYAGHCARRFRKVLPDKQEPREAEFVTLLNRAKRRAAA